MRRINALFVLFIAFAACGNGVNHTAVQAHPTAVKTAQPVATKPVVSTAAPKPKTDKLQHFRTPDGKVACAMGLIELSNGQLSNFARCDVPERSWTAPRPADCPSDWNSGQGLSVEAKGPAMVVCSTDTVFGPWPKFKAGQSVSVGDVECTVSSILVKCNGKDGGFYVSYNSYALH